MAHDRAMLLFADLSPDALRNVSEKHYVESFTCFSIIPDVEVDQSKDMVRVVSPGIPNGLTNAVLHCRLSADRADGVIDETNAYFFSRGVDPRWRLCPSDRPSDLGERLVKKGFVLEEEQPAMAIDLAKLHQDVATPDGLTIERITGGATLRTEHVWIRSLGEGRSLGALLADMWSAYGFGPDAAWQHYVARLYGEPVSCASVFCATGVAGIYAVSTLPEARHRGIGSAITLRALLDARDRGYHVGVLQSSKMGYNAYRRLGFETCFVVKVYSLVKPA